MSSSTREIYHSEVTLRNEKRIGWSVNRLLMIILPNILLILARATFNESKTAVWFWNFNIIHISLMLYYLPIHGLKVVVSISVLCALTLYQGECRTPGRSELNECE